jgi:pilus assembly protein Flp/PilA
VRVLFLQFLNNESAATATAIEYAMIAAGIALAIVTAVSNLGTAVNGKYTAVGTALK